MEADRSAVTQQLLDVVSGDAPTNDAIELLSVVERLSLVIVSIATIMAIWAAEEDPLGLPTATHPRCESRLFMLLGPTVVRALRMAGLSQPSIIDLQAQIIENVTSLLSLHTVFAGVTNALDHQRMTVHDIDNRRLEMVYRFNIAPLLVRHQFSGLSDSDPKIESIR